MKKLLVLAIAVAMVSAGAVAQKKEQERLQECATVLKEVIEMPEGVPPDLLNKAECVIVLPSVKKFAIGIGGSGGRGAIICRGGADFKGAWGAPAMFALEGLNVGLQLGGQATDFILLVMNPKGAASVMSSKVKLGGDASVAAGPKGRDAAAQTDVVMKAEILTYSRSRGLFGGVSLEGSTLRSDGDANKKIYGKELSAQEIAREGKVQTTDAGKAFADLLNQKSPKNLSESK